LIAQQKIKAPRSHLGCEILLLNYKGCDEANRICTMQIINLASSNALETSYSLNEVQFIKNFMSQFLVACELKLRGKKFDFAIEDQILWTARKAFRNDSNVDFITHVNCRDENKIKEAYRALQFNDKVYRQFNDLGNIRTFYKVGEDPYKPKQLSPVARAKQEQSEKNRSASPMGGRNITKRTSGREEKDRKDRGFSFGEGEGRGDGSPEAPPLTDPYAFGMKKGPPAAMGFGQSDELPPSDPGSLEQSVIAESLDSKDRSPVSIMMFGKDTRGSSSGTGPSKKKSSSDRESDPLPTSSDEYPVRKSSNSRTPPSQGTDDHDVYLPKGRLNSSENQSGLSGDNSPADFDPNTSQSRYNRHKGSSGQTPSAEGPIEEIRHKDYNRPQEREYPPVPKPNASNTAQGTWGKKNVPATGSAKKNPNYDTEYYLGEDEDSPGDDKKGTYSKQQLNFDRSEDKPPRSSTPVGKLDDKPQPSQGDPRRPSGPKPLPIPSQDPQNRTSISVNQRHSKEGSALEPSAQHPPGSTWTKRGPAPMVYPSSTEREELVPETSEASENSPQAPQQPPAQPDYAKISPSQPDRPPGGLQNQRNSQDLNIIDQRRKSGANSGLTVNNDNPNYKFPSKSSLQQPADQPQPQPQPGDRSRNSRDQSNTGSNYPHIPKLKNPGTIQPARVDNMDANNSELEFAPKNVPDKLPIKKQNSIKGSTKGDNNSRLTPKPKPTEINMKVRRHSKENNPGGTTLQVADLHRNSREVNMYPKRRPSQVGQAQNPATTTGDIYRDVKKELRAIDRDNWDFDKDYSRARRESQEAAERAGRRTSTSPLQGRPTHQSSSINKPPKGRVTPQRQKELEKLAKKKEEAIRKSFKQVDKELAFRELEEKLRLEAEWELLEKEKAKLARNQEILMKEVEKAQQNEGDLNWIDDDLKRRIHEEKEKQKYWKWKEQQLSEEQARFAEEVEQEQNRIFEEEQTLKDRSKTLESRYGAKLMKDRPIQATPPKTEAQTQTAPKKGVTVTRESSKEISKSRSQRSATNTESQLLPTRQHIPAPSSHASSIRAKSTRPEPEQSDMRTSTRMKPTTDWGNNPSHSRSFLEEKSTRNVLKPPEAIDSVASKRKPSTNQPVTNTNHSSTPKAVQKIDTSKNMTSVNRAPPSRLTSNQPSAADNDGNLSELSEGDYNERMGIYSHMNQNLPHLSQLKKSKLENKTLLERNPVHVKLSQDVTKQGFKDDFWCKDNDMLDAEHAKIAQKLTDKANKTDALAKRLLQRISLSNSTSLSK
jgi:hypothetical protein